jgi:hypothetical protein
VRSGSQGSVQQPGAVVSVRNRIGDAIGGGALLLAGRMESARQQMIVSDVRKAAAGHDAGFARREAAAAAQAAEEANGSADWRSRSAAKAAVDARYRQWEWGRIAALLDRDGLSCYDPAQDHGGPEE